MEVEVPPYEIEDELEVDSERAVLLITDMQNDFAHPDGTLYNPEAEETIETIADLRDSVRDAGIPVWYTQDTHRENDPEWEVWGPHCERGGWGWDIVDELEPEPSDIVFEKSRYDGFYGTQLEHQLRIHERDQLLIGGTVANICVHYTAASAGLRFYDVVHPVETISALNEFDYHAALRQAQWLFQARLAHVDGLQFV